MGYKPGKRTSFAVRKQFRILSSVLSAVDEHFNLLYEELSRFQEEVDVTDADPLNAENLPAVLAEIGTGCAQREIDGLLKLLASRGIDHVGVLKNLAHQDALDAIRNTFRNEAGRGPGNFELIASLAAIRGLPRESWDSAVRAQLAFLNAWEVLKRQDSR